jgi:peptidoglycan/xylan/chitin deacetylase (PgdA/CDA1 family)
MPSAYKKLITQVAISKFIDRTAKQLLPNWVTVFMLHRIEAPDLNVRGMIKRQYLRDCLSYLRDNDFAFISLEEAITRSLTKKLEKKKWVAFSMDDGYFEQVEVAGEVFSEFDCPSTCFLITDFIDGKLWPWDQQLVYIAARARHKQLTLTIRGNQYSLDLSGAEAHRHAIELVGKKAGPDAYAVVAQVAALAGVELPESPPPTYRPTTWDKVRSMEKKGMQFAAHSLTHRIMATLDDIEIQQEIDGSLARVRQECARPANIFCYPSGKADEFDQRASGYLKTRNDVHGAFSAEPGFLSGQRILNNGNYRYTIPRMTIPNDFDEFKLYVSWAQYLRENLQPQKSRADHNPY